MALDAATLYLVVTIVVALSGLLLLWSWSQGRESTALVWWGAAFLLAPLGFSLMMLRAHLPLFVSIDIGNALIAFSYGCGWAGARSLSNRPAKPVWLFVGPLLWILLCRFPPFYGSVDARVAVAAAIFASYFVAAGVEFWRMTPRLPSRGPAIFFVSLHTAFFFARLFRALVSGAVPPPALDAANTALLFETLVFSMCFSFIVLHLTREKIELGHRLAASTDALTGVPNRRGFFEQCNAHFDQDGPKQPVALILFDLDRFKAINDRFGHPIGDHVLKLFAAVASASLWPGDLIGRLGGEEFAVLLPGATADRARVIAAEIIRTFAAAAEQVEGMAVQATASAGAAATDSHSGDLTGLLMRADRALYAAKEQGRNRAELEGGSDARVA